MCYRAKISSVSDGAISHRRVITKSLPCKLDVLHILTGDDKISGFTARAVAI
jgi:hypothetical protein